MLSVALAGKPNAGKSTFFTAATMADVDVGNYPFTTIDPNRGIATVRTRCPCLDLADRCGNDRCRDGKRYVPVSLLDVAGLVPGAHEGKGLGNQFLDALTDADVILNVIDASGATTAEGEPVEVGSEDPLRDVDFIETELDRWLAGIVQRNWESIERQSRSPDFDIEDAITEMLSGFGASEYDVAACLRAIEYSQNPIEWDETTKQALATELRQRTKPIVVVANKADQAPDDLLERLLALDRPVVPATASGELALRRASEAGVIEYDPGDSEFEVLGEISDEQAGGLETIETTMKRFDGTGVQTALNRAVYEELDRITVYPVQNATRWTDGQDNVLPDAHLLPADATPKDLAFAVHSDIGEGYLHALDARSDRRISDDHELSEGDVIKIVSTAS